MGFQFAEPVLFGRVISLLSRSDTMTDKHVMGGAETLLGVWAVIGLCGIGANIAMSKLFRHVLSLPTAFHRERRSGWLLKMMLSGADGLFWMWLSFFREHLATFLATIILLPLTITLNWQLAIALIVLVVVFCTFTILVISKTETAQRQVEGFHSNLAGTAQDALANVLVVQAFTRLSAEATNFRRTGDRVPRKQIPVLNWWAVLSVVTSAASTITVITETQIMVGATAA